MEWRVADELSTEITEPVRELKIRIVTGDVNVTPAAPGAPVSIEIQREEGEDVVVRLVDGVLSISQPKPKLSPLERAFRMIGNAGRQRCSVSVAITADVAVDVASVSAPAVISGSRVSTRVSGVSGDVVLSHLTGPVDVKTVSGDIEAKGVAGDVRLKAVSGDIAVLDGSCASAHANTVSGDVLFDLDLDPAGSYSVNTVSGMVAVRTVDEPNLSIDLSTLSGDLITEFGLGPTRGGPGRRRVTETIGDGGAHLFVKTVSGGLRVLKGRQAA